MASFRDKIHEFASQQSKKLLRAVACISFAGYFGIIIFGFAPVNARILQSGYSTGDLQSAATPQDVAAILTAWVPFMGDVVLLSVLDYCFIVLGLLLFLSLYLLVIREIPPSNKWIPLAIIGIFTTLVSRALDALENLWTILIYTNPSGHAPGLVPLLLFTGSLKWVFVALEYVLLIVLLAGYLKERKNHPPEPHSQAV